MRGTCVGSGDANRRLRELQLIEIAVNDDAKTRRRAVNQKNKHRVALQKSTSLLPELASLSVSF